MVLIVQPNKYSVDLSENVFVGVASTKGSCSAA